LPVIRLGNGFGPLAVTALPIPLGRTLPQYLPREDASMPIPMDAAPSTVPASTVQEEHVAASGLVGRLMARIRGQQFL
jgi:hypothetical protein